MGSVIGLVDEATTGTATFEYDGFGGERSATGTLASLPIASRGDFRFHGMWLDASVGLYYVRARVYDADVGRFLSNDPAEGRRASPETFEGSRFVRGNPYVVNDPSGRSFGSLVEAAVANVVQGALLGGASAAIANVQLWRCDRDRFWHEVRVGAGWGAAGGLLTTGAQFVVEALFSNPYAHYFLGRVRERLGAIAMAVIEQVVIQTVVAYLNAHSQQREVNRRELAWNVYMGIAMTVGLELIAGDADRMGETRLVELVETALSIFIWDQNPAYRGEVKCR